MSNERIHPDEMLHQDDRLSIEEDSPQANKVVKPPEMIISDGPALRAFKKRAAESARLQQQQQKTEEEIPVEYPPQAAKELDRIFPSLQRDRRLLAHVPPKGGIRSDTDRRGQQEIDNAGKRRIMTPSLPEHRGVRYEVDMEVKVICYAPKGRKRTFKARCSNVSTSGMKLSVEREAQAKWISEGRRIKVKFDLEPGMLPEGYEMYYSVDARAVYAGTQQNPLDIGLRFVKTLPKYAYEKRGRWYSAISLMGFFVLISLIVLMRLNSASFGTISRIAYIYGIITSTYLLTRYLFAAMYKPTPVNKNFRPGVSIVIPCYDEEDWIQKTILSCLDQDYPREKIEVIVVDDHSRDRSPLMIKKIVEELWELDELYETKSRVRYVRQAQNLGKREAMARGVALAKHDFVVFVDSDSFLDPYAIKHLVQPFQDPKVGGVSGRTDVANTYTNMLTKMQAVKYYFSFRVLKAAEGYFDAVSCLSGPLSCYRKDVILEYMDDWLNQQFFGMKATFGDDRSMTNFILRHHRTDYQDTAICSTIVPKGHKMFLKQQMRWKRSWLRESSIAGTFMWRKEPLMALSFYTGFILPILAPFIIFLNLVYLPIFQGTFPLTFLIGFAAMSIMMCLAQLLLRRSSIWLYGLGYNIYHILVLVWQMPIAWFTFWKSTWGTRMTASDLKASGIKTDNTAA